MSETLTPSEPDRLIRVGARRQLAAFVVGLAAAALRAAKRGGGGRRKPESVLLLEPFGMGDVLSLEPLVRTLHEHGLAVRVCARPEWRPLLPAECVAEWVPSRVPWSAYDNRVKYTLAAYVSPDFRAFLGTLRGAARAAAGLDTRGDVRSILLLHAAGCRPVYSFSRYLGSTMRVFPAAARLLGSRCDLPRWRLNLEMLKPLGLDRKPNMAPPSLAHLAEAAPVEPEPRVGLVPLAPWPGRAWAPENWQMLCSAIRDLKRAPVALAGPGQKDAVAAAVRGACDVLECGSVPDWVREINRCVAVVALNTGPMHVADALGRPLVVLDGPSKMPLWTPSGRRSVVVSHASELDCAPCHQAGLRPRCGSACLRKITVDEVAKALRSVLLGEDDRPRVFG